MMDAPEGHDEKADDADANRHGEADDPEAIEQDLDYKINISQPDDNDEHAESLFSELIEFSIMIHT